MNLDKAKILLDKINRLYTSMSLDKDNIAPIEKDLMRDYIKQLYEQFLEQAANAAISTKKQATKVTFSPPPVKRNVEVKTTPPPPPPVADYKPAVKAVPSEPRMSTPPPVIEAKPIVAAPPPPPPPVVEAKPIVVSPPPPPIVQVKPTVVTPPPRRSTTSPVVNPEHSDLFHFNLEAKELSEKLSLTRISDLSKAMGVNERIFTVNELFGADNSLYRDVIKDLNNMRSFDEAKAYLSANIAEKYNWTHKSKRNKAKNFIKLVRRRYI